MRALLPSLYRANQGILRQKLGLIDALVSKHGQEEAKSLYKTVCPIVKASIGMHIRHSMDHVERAAAAAIHFDQRKINYDLRERGGLDENDMDAAVERLLRVQNTFEKLSSSESQIPVIGHNIEACFMLSGDSNDEYALPSTVARELGFAAHHAIHHLAMVRICATHTGGLSEDDLPSDFGRAPSTVNYDRKIQK